MTRASLILLCLTVALIYAALVLPADPSDLKVSVLRQFPLELPVLLGCLVALGSNRFIAGTVSLLFSFALVALVLLKLADQAMITAYQRPFNPIVDMSLIPAGVALMVQTFGATLAYSLFLGFGCVFLLLFALVARGLLAWSRLPVKPAVRSAVALLTIGFVGLVAMDARRQAEELPFVLPGNGHSTWLIQERLIMIGETNTHLKAFQALAAADPYADQSNLLNLIGDRDVLFIFIESYGRASFDQPAYTATHLPILTNADAKLRAEGLAMRSGWLTSPTAGGQSWLAHGTLASGLWTEDSATYRSMLKSGRKSLFHLAQDAGFRTNAVMPAITMDWPESQYMGFEQILEAEHLAYQGPPLNWVTMPDQYTLAAYESLLGPDPRRDFTQIALISSHAPWTPILPILAWDEIEDGSVFDAWADAGPSPREVWRDRDRVRDHYRQSIAYSLEVTLDYIAREAHKGRLVFLVGDHQPAEFVAQGKSRDVAIHVIGPPDVMALVDPWGWSDGLIPDQATPSWRMDRFRDRFIEAFSASDEIKVGG
ncbi:MAG: sulfatase-like hydrolase/transferase [Pseudomonadota bacterium]